MRVWCHSVLRVRFSGWTATGCGPCRCTVTENERKSLYGLSVTAGGDAMYLDSAILVKLVVREPDSDFYADLLDGRTAVQASELTMPECRSALLRKREHGDIDARTCERAWERLQSLWSKGGGLLLQPVTRTVLLEAGEVICQCAGAVPVRTLDAIHIASCLLARAYPLMTNDRVMRSAAERLGIPLGATPP